MSKKIEWRDTAPPWLRTVNYSLLVRNRYVFYYAISGKHKKIINMAKALASPNHIGVVFIFGIRPKKETIQKNLDECPFPLLVLLVDISMELIQEYDQVSKEKKRIEKITSAEELVTTVSKIKKAIEAGAIKDATAHKIFAEELALLNRYPQLLDELMQAQDNEAIAVSNFGAKSHITSDYNSELASIAATLYPYGVEANAPSEDAGKMLAIKKLVECAKAGVDTAFAEQYVGMVFAPQLSLFGTYNSMQVMDEIASYVDDALARDGAICVRCFLQKFMSQPYGLYECNFYMFHLAAGIRHLYEPGHYWNDGVASYEVDMFAQIRFYLQNMDSKRVHPATIYRESPKMQEMTSAMSEIFGNLFVASPRNLDGAIMTAISWCWNHLQEPLAVTDPRWHELMWNKNEMVLPALAEKYYDFVMDIEARKRDLLSTRSIVEARYPDRKKLELYYKSNYIRGGAIGTYAAEDFYERVDQYMQSDVCRECGRQFDLPLKSGTSYCCQDDKGNILRFTKKEIIGLNKKLLGRFQNEYFCIPCLCEVLDNTPTELYEKVHAFREQGCELF